MPDEQTRTPKERLQAAGEAFASVNRMLPEGMTPFQLPDFLETSAGNDALCRLLVAKGLIDEREYVEAKISRMAEMVEQFTEQVRQVKREALGIAIAGPGRMN